MLKKITLRDQAYRELARRIISGVFPAGSRLTEEGLCALLGISRTPVREALRQLSQEGLLEFIPGRGCRVKRQNEDELRSLCECRAILAENALELGFCHFPAEQLRRLRAALLCPGESPGENRENSLRVDTRLHALIIEVCPNRHLAGLLEQLEHQTAPFRNYRTRESDNPELITQERLSIIDAILAGDLPLAKSLLRRHIQHGVEL